MAFTQVKQNLSRIFYKMQALGNDCIIIPEKNELWSYYNREYISLLCDRKFGVGADQLILFELISENRCSIKIFNNNAEPAETCGNAMRCLALLTNYLYASTNIEIQTETRTYNANILDDDNIKIDMGSYKYNNLPDKELNFINELYTDKWQDFLGVAAKNIGYVELTNPHLVIETEDFSKLEPENAKLLTNAGNYFKSGANISFVKELDNHNLASRVIERGAGETLACGSGACAIAAFWQRKKTNSMTQDMQEKSSNIMNINFRGGSLKIEYINGGGGTGSVSAGSDSKLIMIGSANLIYKGELSSYVS